MIDRRDWIKTCIAAASAALLDISGLPVVQPSGPNSDNDSGWVDDEESSESMSTSGKPLVWPPDRLEAWGDSDSDGYRQFHRCSR